VVPEEQEDEDAPDEPELELPDEPEPPEEPGPDADADERAEYEDAKKEYEKERGEWQKKKYSQCLHRNPCRVCNHPTRTNEKGFSESATPPLSPAGWNKLAE
jgi:hypothetical protein